MSKCIAVISAVYNRLGDPRSKNMLIFILLLLCAFGMIDPQRATSLRDIVLSMAL